MRIPRFHRRSLVGREEGREHGVAPVDVGQIAFDDLGLVALRSAPEVAAHRIDGVVAVLA
jgi:hypothetical protein